MIVVDSSGWIEFFTDGPLADEFARRLRTLTEVVTPVIVIYEVYKTLKRELSEDDALAAVSAMESSRVVSITQDLALAAADLSLAHGLAMADSLILATAEAFQAELVTSDRDFEGIAGVTYLPKLLTN